MDSEGRSWAGTLPLLLTAFFMAGCGLSSVRASQDWSAVADQRLHRACHVGQYGSGVIFRSDDAGSVVLTCAHLVEDGAAVRIHYRRPDSDRWSSQIHRVVFRSHPHKEDLAVLVHAEPLPGTHLPPLDLVTETPVAADILSIAFGAEERPLVHRVHTTSYLHSVSTVIPDHHGQREWTIPKVLLHGGIRQANSGSPVMAGDTLIGLAESSPGFATIDGSFTQGVVASSPENLRSVLTAAGLTPTENLPAQEP